MLITRPTHLVFDRCINEAAALNDGIYAQADLPAEMLDANGLLRNIVVLGPIDGEHQRGVDLLPILDSDGAEDDTFTITLHRISVISDEPNNKGPRSYRTEKLGSLACTASDQTYAAGVIDESNAYRGCDTIVFTPTTLGTAIFTKVGATPVEYSPANDTPAIFPIPDLDGAYALGIEITINTGSGKGNVLAEVKT